jgi:hypothetical protein
MNNEFESAWNYAAVAELKYYNGSCLEGLRKTMKILSYDSRCLGRESNRNHPNTSLEYYHYVIPDDVVV